MLSFMSNYPGKVPGGKYTKESHPCVNARIILLDLEDKTNFSCAKET